MDIIIRNGTLITDTQIYKADIGISNGKIISISNKIEEPAKKEIDATGKYVFPGFIDAHTHLELPITDTISSVDDFYTGTKAAAFGGTTSIVDYIVPYKSQTLKDAFKLWQNKAKNKAVIDYGFHMTISDPTDKILDEINELYNLGISSIKCFTAYPGKFMMTDDQLYRVLLESKNNNILLSMHCENGLLIDYNVKKFISEGKITPGYHGKSRPEMFEAEAVSRIIDIAKEANAPIFIAHLSTAEGLERIKKARNNNQPVFSETCPQYLIFDDSVYENNNPNEVLKFICSPPIRPKENIEPLWQGLLNDDIQIVATDHCPFNLNIEKQSGLNDFTKTPNGIPGIEDRVNIIFSEGVIKRKLNLNKFVKLVSTLPAKIFGMYPTKGCLEVGSDADIVIYNPDKTSIISAKTHHQNVDYNIYEGIKITGKPEIVISNGEIIVNKEEFMAQKGRGKYIKRQKALFD